MPVSCKIFQEYKKNYVFPVVAACASIVVVHRLSEDPRYIIHTVCPRSSDPFYIVSYCIKKVTTSWTHGILSIPSILTNGFDVAINERSYMYCSFFSVDYKINLG